MEKKGRPRKLGLFWVEKQAADPEVFFFFGDPEIGPFFGWVPVGCRKRPGCVSLQVLSAIEGISWVVLFLRASALVSAQNFSGA